MLNKKLAIILLLLSAVVYAWSDSDPPEGHVESLSGLRDGDTLGYAASLTRLIGTAHKAGDNQSDANTRLNSYSLYLTPIDGTTGDDWEKTADDDPSGSTTLSADIDSAATTIPVNDASGFEDPTEKAWGFTFIEIGSEILRVTAASETSLTVDQRGFNESSAASHTSGDSVAELRVFFQVGETSGFTIDGSPYDAIGWDVSDPSVIGSDDGTEGNLLQGNRISIEAGRYMAFLRVVDSVGNTNLESGGVDQLNTYGADSYVNDDGGGTGAMADGLEDDEIVAFQVREDDTDFETVTMIWRITYGIH